MVTNEILLTCQRWNSLDRAGKVCFRNSISWVEWLDIYLYQNWRLQIITVTQAPHRFRTRHITDHMIFQFSVLFPALNAYHYVFYYFQIWVKIKQSFETQPILTHRRKNDRNYITIARCTTNINDLTLTCSLQKGCQLLFYNFQARSY